MAGENTNGCLGIGTKEARRNKIYSLSQFTNKKVYEIAVGDYHTIAIVSGCNCVDSINGTAQNCKGRNKCNGGSDVYGWGANTHGQVDGFPSQENINTPQIIPYFNMNKQVSISHIAVSRSRCIAVSNQTCEVYEWGYRLPPINSLKKKGQGGSQDFDDFGNAMLT